MANKKQFENSSVQGSLEDYLTKSDLMDLQASNLSLTLEIPHESSKSLTTQQLLAAANVANSISANLIREKIIKDPLEIKELRPGSLFLVTKTFEILNNNPFLGNVLANIISGQFVNLSSRRRDRGQEKSGKNTQLPASISIKNGRKPKESLLNDNREDVGFKNPHARLGEGTKITLTLKTGQEEVILEIEL